MSATTAELVDDLLRPFDPAEVDRLHPLLAGGPALMERLTGARCHGSKLFRLATTGAVGVKLQTCDHGGGRLTSIRWIARFMVEVAAARDAAAEKKAAAKRIPRRARPARRRGRTPGRRVSPPSARQVQNPRIEETEHGA